MEIEGLRDGDLDEAARLAAMRHTRAREAFPFLPVTFEDPEETRGLLKKVLADEHTAGYVARDGGRMVGFAIGKADAAEPGSLMARFMEERTGAVGLGVHGADPDADAFAVYSALYSAMARDWVRTGFVAHSFHVYDTDREAHEALVNLGFGRKMVTAFARVQPGSASRPAGVDIRQVDAEDMDAVMKLEHELTAYHSEPPIFMALDPLTDEETERFQKALIAQDGNAHLVAFQGERPAGMLTFQNPPIFLGPQLKGDGVVYLYQGIVASDARTGGVGEALLSEAMEWMAEQGFHHCGLHYHAANPTGGPFWRKHGFAAVEHTMVRILDSRIGWARTW